jgi:hypothetical protein
MKLTKLGFLIFILDFPIKLTDEKCDLLTIIFLYHCILLVLRGLHESVLTIPFSQRDQYSLQHVVYHVPDIPGKSPSGFTLILLFWKKVGRPYTYLGVPAKWWKGLSLSLFIEKVQPVLTNRCLITETLTYLEQLIKPWPVFLNRIWSLTSSVSSAWKLSFSGRNDNI